MKIRILLFYSNTLERQYIFTEDKNTDELSAEKLLSLFKGKFNIRYLKKDGASIKTIKWQEKESVIKYFN